MVRQVLVKQKPRKIETTFEKWTKRINEGYYERIKSMIIETSDITAKQAAELIVI